jgi:hypothetical protein
MNALKSTTTSPPSGPPRNTVGLPQFPVIGKGHPTTG